MIFYTYLTIMNVLGLYLAYLDKHRAKLRQKRISESALMFCAVLGGALGLYLGLLIFNHKTSRMKFMVGVPFILTCWAAALIIFKGAF